MLFQKAHEPSKNQQRTSKEQPSSHKVSSDVAKWWFPTDIKCNSQREAVGPFYNGLEIRLHWPHEISMRLEVIIKSCKVKFYA